MSVAYLNSENMTHFSKIFHLPESSNKAVLDPHNSRTKPAVNVLQDISNTYMKKESSAAPAKKQRLAGDTLIEKNVSRENQRKPFGLVPNVLSISRANVAKRIIMEKLKFRETNGRLRKSSSSEQRVRIRWLEI